MGLTLDKALKILNGYKWEQAVWNEVVGFLSQFVDDEVNKAESAIISDDNGQVPQELVQRVVSEILEDKLVPLEEEIKKIEGSSVEVSNEQEAEEASSKPISIAGKSQNQDATKSVAPTQLRRRSKAQSSG